MRDQIVVEQENGGATGLPNGRKRERSLIEFPYTDLERAVELARALHGEGGRAKISQTALAVAMNQSVSGGTFRGRLSAAKMFGLIGTEQAQVWLEPIGLRILDSTTDAAAKAEAFLRIPLYAAMFERYNGHPLPPPVAIERQMESLGVPPKQKERARQAFSSSATYANFIAHNGRFSKPTQLATSPALPVEHGKNEGARSGEVGRGGGSKSDAPSIPLEYQLIDLLKRQEIGDEERKAVWTLIQFLAGGASADQDAA